MDIQQVIASSPVRILENKMAGSLGSGKLGVCVAHAGIGKTAFLIQIGIDAAVSGKKVLHCALGQTTEHVQSWYETLLNDLLARCAVDNADELIAEAATRRVIQSSADRNFSAERLEQIIELYRANMQFTPDIIIIDGYDWETHDDSETAGLLDSCKSCAGLLGAALWMSAGTDQTDQPQTTLPRPCNTFDTLIDYFVVGMIVGYFAWSNIDAWMQHQIVKGDLITELVRPLAYVRQEFFFEIGLKSMALAVQAIAGHSFRFWRPARRDNRLIEPAEAILAQVGLLERKNVIAAQVSHGEHRQLEIAMALATRPGLLLLDEPMAGMGSEESSRMINILRELKQSMTMLLIEHDMDVVFALADRITVLVYGRVIASGAPELVRNDPSVKRAYLGDGE